MAKRKGGPTEFGIALRRVREAKGLTQQELADAIGVARLAITRLETSPAANPTWATVTALAVALDVKTDAFGE